MALRTGSGQDWLAHIDRAGRGNGTIICCTLAAAMRWGGRRGHRFCLGDRLLLAGTGLHRHRFAAHDPREGACLCDRGQDGKTETPRGRLYRGWGFCGTRRQPLYPCLPLQHRPHSGGVHEQPDLRHDRRVGPPTTPRGRISTTTPYGCTEPGYLISRIWPLPPVQTTSPAGLHTMSGNLNTQ